MPLLHPCDNDQNKEEDKEEILVLFLVSGETTTAGVVTGVPANIDGMATAGVLANNAETGTSGVPTSIHNTLL